MKTIETQNIINEINNQFKLLDRYIEIKESNNINNPNKNICCLEITDYLGTSELSKYLHTFGDVLLNVSNKFNIHDVTDLVFGITVEESRNIFKEYSKKNNNKISGYLVSMFDHIILLNKSGKTIIDASELNGVDNRTVLDSYLIY